VFLAFGCLFNDDEDRSSNPGDGNSESRVNYCDLSAGGACECIVKCGDELYGMECDGARCTCTRGGSSRGSFTQFGACNYEVSTHRDAYNAVSIGCPVAYPCTEN
jgi:hypothetical protein